MNVMPKIIVAACMAALALYGCKTAAPEPPSARPSFTAPVMGAEERGPLPPEFFAEAPEGGQRPAPGAPRDDDPPEFTVKLDEILPAMGAPARVSLNFRQAPAGVVVGTLAEASGFNFHLSPSVAAQTLADMTLRDIPWPEALRVITQANDLAATVDGRDVFSQPRGADELTRDKVIVVMTRAEYERSRERAREEADRAAGEASRLLEGQNRMATASYRFRYADPTEALVYLESLYGIAPAAEKGKDEAAAASPAPPPGAIRFSLYKAENLLTVTAPPREMERVMALAREIDTPARQVFIESRIVEIQRSSIAELGVRWGGYVTRQTDQVFPAAVGVYGAGAGGDVVALPPGGAVDPATGAMLADPAGGLVGVTLGGVSGAELLRARLYALEQAGVSRTLSNPKIMTVNGGVAVIKSGREIPYQSSSANTGTTVQFREAVISLTVRPSIMDDRRVRLRIQANKNEVDPTLSVQGTPAIKKKELSTNVVVENGGSAALGGMFEMEDGDFSDRVPWFHDIPFLGWLFKNKRSVDNRLELLVFITPTIVEEGR